MTKNKKRFLCPSCGNFTLYQSPTGRTCEICTKCYWSDNKGLTEYCLKKLFDKVPEIKSIKGKLKEELEYDLERGFGAHVIYEDIFSYYVFDLMNKHNRTKQEDDTLKRSFELIEELAHDEDIEVRNVAKVSFIEPILGKLQPTKDIEKYLLPKSLQLAMDIGQFRFGFNPKTWEKEEGR